MHIANVHGQTMTFVLLNSIELNKLYRRQMGIKSNYKPILGNHRLSCCLTYCGAYVRIDNNCFGVSMQSSMCFDLPIGHQLDYSKRFKGKHGCW